MEKYDHKKIEGKWQKEWEEKGIYRAWDGSSKKKFYGLIEFPYPSGDGLHVGHIRSNTAMDVIARKRRAEGYNVLYPIGWDAFGLPTENYAIKTGIQPALVTKQNTDTFRRQLKSLGFSFDWDREVNTTDPKYFKWTQWIFLQFFKKDLAYKKKMNINWCPKCLIGLANEEVIGGNCERCGTPVERREKEQWMLAITKYADRLDKDLDDVDFQERIKIQQRNWIGKSEGAEIEFKINPTPAPLPEGEGKNAEPSPLGREGWGEFGYQTTNPETWQVLQEKALEMRKNPTEAENLLWQELRDNSIGCHFRRQQIIGRFIVDFVCLEKKLVIEVDGDIHDYQKEADEERTAYLKESGFEVIRFKNDEVVKDIESVKTKITHAFKALSFGEGLGGVNKSIKVFTTRPDTLFGVTYVVLAPDHSLVRELKSQIKNWSAVEKYLIEAKSKTEIERTAEDKEKTGVRLEGVMAVNPANGEQVPVWIADYVLANYGTGAVMAVLAHDDRDFAFAKKYNLPLKPVIAYPILNADNPPREGKEESPREVIHAILRNPANDTYLVGYLKDELWGDKKPINFVIGGIEKSEKAEDTAAREIGEETGYTDISLVKELPIEVIARFFQAQKNVNRIAHVRTFVFELKSDKRGEVAEEEKAKHEFCWVAKDKVASELNVPTDQLVWNYYISGGFAYTGEGSLVNSGEFNRLTTEEAGKKITEKFGQKKVTYKLRDWVFSRQRYWGEPIPMVKCEKDGWVPVPEGQLPVELPAVERYQPTETGESPLAAITDWVKTTCPICSGPAERETDTMPNWAGSSWYYLRYADPRNEEAFAGKENLKYWTPVDWYNGGMEHTTLHLLYSRFWHKFLFDLGLVPTSEPYHKRTSHGLILAEGGEKMSKSKGNVVNPDKLVELYGADTLRVYEMFMGPFDQAIAWSTESMIGPRRFLERVWKLGHRGSTLKMPQGRTSVSLSSLLHQTIKKVGEDIEAMRFNTAISALMILVNVMESASAEGSGVSKKDFEILLKLLAPFAPHITDELWHELGNADSIHLAAWPKYNEGEMEEKEWIIIVQVNGIKRDEFIIGADISPTELENMAMQRPIIVKWVGGKEVKRVVHVKGKLVNIVV